ncbi:MAG: hypothetical protein WBE76_09355 [Terracidiphilus sp.]
MNALRRIGKYAFVCALVYLASSCLMASHAAPSAADAGQEQARDGQHDFDFELGSWKIHLKRRLHPLTGSTTWVEFDGTSVTRKVWDGRSQLEEFETDSPAAGHIEGLTLRLHDPQSHQWRLYWANSKDGTVVPAQIGEFKDGCGEFYGQDTLNGKNILIRFIWSNTNTSMPHFEQSFSGDGGKTWEVNWITDQTRVADQSAEANPAPAVTQTDPGTANTTTAERDGQHDFDFNFGTWKTQIKRRLDPLTGSTTWIELSGTVTVRKVWNGRGQLEEIEADGPNGHWEGLTLFLYNPQSHQWSQIYANRKDGILNPPSIGEFKNGRGELFDQEMFNGRAVLLRVVWSDIAPDSHHFEEAFSDDGGKTWEPNFVATLTREKP